MEVDILPPHYMSKKSSAWHPSKHWYTYLLVYQVSAISFFQEFERTDKLRSYHAVAKLSIAERILQFFFMLAKVHSPPPVVHISSMILYDSQDFIQVTHMYLCSASSWHLLPYTLDLSPLAK